MALPQTPLPMPFMFPTELITLGRVITRRSPVPPRRQLRSGEELELRHKAFSRIRPEKCQPRRRVDHAKPAPQRIFEYPAGPQRFRTDFPSIHLPPTNRAEKARGKGSGDLPAEVVDRARLEARTTSRATRALAVLAICADADTADDPVQPGTIRLSVNEVCRLINILIVHPARRTTHRLRWSNWRLRRQTQADEATAPADTSPKLNHDHEWRLPYQPRSCTTRISGRPDGVHVQPPRS
jgi:hypothetical protein